MEGAVYGARVSPSDYLEDAIVTDYYVVVQELDWWPRIRDERDLGRYYPRRCLNWYLDHTEVRKASFFSLFR